jgi:hypothetical protein
MKTAMQELIDWIECDNNNNVYDILDMAKELLEKEKEQIIDAHIEGQRVFDNYKHTQWTNDQAEEYYNQTYNQNK